MYTRRNLFRIPVKLKVESDRSDSFPFDCQSNEISFGSQSKGKLSLRKTVNTIAVIVFLLVVNQTEFILVHDHEEKCPYNRIPFNLKGNKIKFLRA